MTSTCFNSLGSWLAQPPAWAQMWLLAAVIFGGCKLVTWRAAAGSLSPGATLAYLFCWPGLDPAPFALPRMHSCRVRGRQWAWTLAKIALGLWLVLRIAPDWRGTPLVAGWLGIVGIGFVLHFGVFELLTWIWRTLGYDVQPLMNAPHRSTSLAEFWSRRWNRAFRDLSSRLILRPLLPRLGVTGASLCVFLFSGVVHDLVISVPAGSGYGLPTAYFLVQTGGLLLQRTHSARRWQLNTGVAGWIVTAACVCVPLPLLFHRPFLTLVVLPFLSAIAP